MTRLIECCSFARRQSPKPCNTTTYIGTVQDTVKNKGNKKRERREIETV